MTTLHELAADVHSCDHPTQHENYREFVSQLDEVLVALGESTIGRDKIAHMCMSPSALSIVTVRYMEGCDQHSDMDIPVHILKSPDPVHSAKCVRLSSTIDATRRQINQHRRDIERLTTDLRRFEAQLYSITQPSLDFTD